MTKPGASLALAMVFAAAALCAAGCAGSRPQTPAAAVLRVCADPNNLPFSNDKRQGFENAIARIVAGDLGRPIEYTWWPQRRGFFRATLTAGLCDVVIGVPEHLELALTTRPYYRSTYVFVARKARALDVHSLDDPRLRRLSIGLHLIGDDYAAVPPGAALARRGIIQNVKGYSIYGDYAKPNPPADLIEAVADGSVDVALAWGPLAGYFAAQSTEALDVTPVEPVTGIPFEFSIAMGVRRADAGLRDRLNSIITARQADIDRVLNEFHVPRAGR